MAVAVHVGRVAKEYTPYGYSIMEDVSGAFRFTAGAGGATVYLPMFDDADARIEAIGIISEGGYNQGGDDNVDSWVIRLASFDAAGAATTHALVMDTNTAITPAAQLTANVRVSATATTPVIAAGSTLALVVAENGTANGNIDATVLVRVRRKA